MDMVDVSKKINEVVEAAMKALRSGQPDAEIRGILESGLKDVPIPLAQKVLAMFDKLLAQRAENERQIMEIYTREWQPIDQDMKAAAHRVASLSAVADMATRIRDKLIVPPVGGNSNNGPK